jgi:hypothetical protein
MSLPAQRSSGSMEHFAEPAGRCATNVAIHHHAGNASHLFEIALQRFLRALLGGNSELPSKTLASASRQTLRLITFDLPPNSKYIAGWLPILVILALEDMQAWLNPPSMLLLPTPPGRSATAGRGFHQCLS